MIRENSVLRFDKAPHSNAAIVFINWLLSPAGQKEWSDAGRFNTRRKDVAPFAAELALYDGDEKRFARANIEETLPKMTDTQEMLKKLFGR